MTMVEPVTMDRAKEGLEKAVGGIGHFARRTSMQLVEQAGDLKDAAVETIGKRTADSPDTYEQRIVDYNGAYTAMNDRGLSLLRQRERTTDLIELVELLVNSIANTPRSFDTSFDEIEVQKAMFLGAEEFAQRDLEAARSSATSAGAGFTAGAAVASLAPSGAMWVATTFGTASTGTAISTLSGAAATKAALAWLGGGALSVGGGGAAGGTALLALAGPVGWTVAGATLLTSIALFTKKKIENREAKHETLAAVMQNTSLIETMDAEIDDLLHRTTTFRELLLASYAAAMDLFGSNFLTLTAPQRSQLVALVNNTAGCAALLGSRIEQRSDEE